MKYLGIDYGSKRVGIAVSDSEGTMAFPKCVLPADAVLPGAVAAIAKEEGIGELVIGESKDYAGKPNAIMARAEQFIVEIKKMTGLPVRLEPEFMTSAAALHIQGKTSMHDASAAALILQSFLDKKGKKA